MAGNVSEWTLDAYHDSYAGAPADGKPWESKDGVPRVLRGGSWLNPASQGRAADRDYYAPGVLPRRVGFRLARDARE